jgi:transcriptional regulator with XRE-family HTH domain
MTRLRTRHGEAQTLAKLFGKRLCEAQEMRDMKTEPLARATGIGLRLVQKHRNGEHLPTQDNLFRYSRALDFPVPWFFQEDEADAA